MENNTSPSIHRRKSSKSDDENTLVINEPSSPLSLSPLPTRPAPPPPRSPLSPQSPAHSAHSHARAPTSPLQPIAREPRDQTSRSRVHSTPAPPPLMGHSRTMSISLPSPYSPTNPGPGSGSAGPYRTTFKVNGHPPPSSPFRASISSPQNLGLNGHSRTRSISTPYSPPLPSPLSFSFPANAQSHPPLPQSPNGLTASTSAPENALNAVGSGAEQAERERQERQKHARRHSRLHSRNLSIFFPRPGSLPVNNTISEDGAQELEFPSHSDVEAMPMPSAGSSVSFPSGRRMTTSLQNGRGSETSLGAGFTFGGRPTSISGPTPPLMSNGPSSASSTSSRRGHHHKHSLSHNFFSFLEPGAGGPQSAGLEQEGPQELYTQPTPTPMSPWNPISPFPKSAGIPPGSAGLVSPSPSRSSFSSQGHSHSQSQSYSHLSPTPSPFNATNAVPTTSASASDAPVQVFALPFTILQFTTGAFLWVSGQQIGSLGTTALGYWVVFDAFGVGIATVLGRWLTGSSTSGAGLRRPYGNARIETVLQFAQSVYLMFSSVYVCKETVEHILLSAGSTGGAEGHHHHIGDEDPNSLPGIQFPYLLASIAFFTIILSAAVFDNHKSLVDVTGNRIPSMPTLIRLFTSLFSQRSSHITNVEPPPSSKLGVIMSNPYVVCPLAMCAAIWWGGIGLAASQHTAFDLTLAVLITFVTFRVSYSSSVVLGTVLLQTAPRRVEKGRSGRMEAFLRAMKDLERHPQVLHLPAPHIWQLTPAPAASSALSLSSYNQTATSEQLVVTLELHVRRDLPDEDVLHLTRWAWEKCVGALTVGANGIKGDSGMPKADVTVGVVRG